MPLLRIFTYIEICTKHTKEIFLFANKVDFLTIVYRICPLYPYDGKRMHYIFTQPNIFGEKVKELGHQINICFEGLISTLCTCANAFLHF
jgi:hypothetical protein